MASESPKAAGPTTSTGIVLVHGGLHAGDCWDATVAAIGRLRPDLRVLAVDLPGRRNRPGDLRTLTIGDCVTSVIEQIDEAGLDRVVLVGHSLAGITIPGVATQLGAGRVERLVFVAANVPTEGGAIIDNIAGPLRYVARRRAAQGGRAEAIPRWLARWVFCNGMTAEQRTRNLDRLHPESTRVTVEPVHRDLPAVPRTWILTKRDRALSRRNQERSIDNLGGVDEVIEIDACHNVMFSHPEALSALLVRHA